MATTFGLIDPNLKWYLTLALLTIALLVGVVLTHRVLRDVKGDAEESLTDPDDLLNPLSEAFASGQMSQEEYERIQASVRRGVLLGTMPEALPVRPKVVKTIERPIVGDAGEPSPQQHTNASEDAESSESPI